MTPTLARIERTNLILAVALTALAGALWGVRGTLSAATGAAIACADFHYLGRLGAKAIAAVKAGSSPWGLGFALICKMAALFALVFVAIRLLHLDVPAFAIGFSVFVISILLVGLAATQAEAEVP